MLGVRVAQKTKKFEMHGSTRMPLFFLGLLISMPIISLYQEKKFAHFTAGNNHRPTDLQSDSVILTDFASSSSVLFWAVAEISPTKGIIRGTARASVQTWIGRTRTDLCA